MLVHIAVCFKLGNDLSMKFIAKKPQQVRLLLYFSHSSSQTPLSYLCYSYTMF